MKMCVCMCSAAWVRGSTPQPASHTKMLSAGGFIIPGLRGLPGTHAAACTQHGSCCCSCHGSSLPLRACSLCMCAQCRPLYTHMHTQGYICCSSKSSDACCLLPASRPQAQARLPAPVPKTQASRPKPKLELQVLNSPSPQNPGSNPGRLTPGLNTALSLS